MMHCASANCRGKIVRGVLCSKCGMDNSREAGMIALEILDERGIEELDEFMLIHFPDEAKRKKLRHVMIQINYNETRAKQYDASNRHKR
ncbi:MAG: hypothetical protein ACREA1_02860 [Nitrosotalea sp.]